MSQDAAFLLCPGQGAQAVGMGSSWHAASSAARSIFERADAMLGDRLGAPLSRLCFEGPSEAINRTNVSQPAIYTCGVACHAGLVESQGPIAAAGAAGLSLGEYTALHLAGVFDFETGLDLVANRGHLMQQAAEASSGSMVALIGAEEADSVDVEAVEDAEAPRGQARIQEKYARVQKKDCSIRAAADRKLRLGVMALPDTQHAIHGH